ncbi:lytic transglycosylase domain-containing protein [Dehalobacter sp. DCM]|uniref:hypothetical protein n=1 Tax=Dehalobacter sp. DCM TaxID=2907827 RepID=UPI0030820522|nr:lytic transglycosylase domain-containing protein [Dehalobacter sp. DCM]
MIAVKENRRTDSSSSMAYIIILMAIVIVWFSSIASEPVITDIPGKNADISATLSNEKMNEVIVAESPSSSADMKEQTTISANDQDEVLSDIAVKYGADPDYLAYIIGVEKTFNLQPGDLLALIAQETGFHPQTHMDGGSLSYNTTQMKLASAKTAYMAITEYYKMEIDYPTDELLTRDKYYAAFLAGGYLKYLNDIYDDRYEAYTAYNLGINGRMTYYDAHGNFNSPYAVKVTGLGESFREYLS